MEPFIETLMLGHIGFVVAFAYLSIRGLKQLKDAGAPKSSLSRDGTEDRKRAAPASSAN